MNKLTDIQQTRVTQLVKEIIDKQVKRNIPEEEMIAELESELRWRSAAIIPCMQNTIPDDAPRNFKSYETGSIACLVYSLAIIELFNSNINNGLTSLEREFSITNNNHPMRF